MKKENIVENTTKPMAYDALLGVVNSKIKQLLDLTDEFIFPAFYTHTNKQMWKISNPYTQYGSETLVLCGVDEGINTALDLAIEHISKAKDKFYNGDNNAYNQLNTIKIT